MIEADHENLEHLIDICSAPDAMCEDMCGPGRPLGAPENRYESMSGELDRVDYRMERIERRLELTDA
jgi:hypothetical protein